MQSVNVLAVNSWFLAAFLGTAALCVVTMVAAAVQLHEPFALFLLLGGLAYLVGCFLVTVVFNVPMNNALAALPVAGPTERPAGQRISPTGQLGITCARPRHWQPPRS